MKDRIYICHTYYHVYVTFLKELKLRAEADPAKKAGAATLVLSKMSNNFENLKSRVESTGLFEEVLEFDEKREDFFPELEKYREDTGSFLGNLKNRIRFTKEYARLEASYVPVDLRTYKDIYVYCDSDPIGYYLNQNHIRYHAVEDGLNCLKNFDAARYDNRGHFKIKAFLSMYLNLIFVQNGYGKYCMDMEVNDISAIRYPCPRYIELPRKPLEDRLTAEEIDDAIGRDKSTYRVAHLGISPAPALMHGFYTVDGYSNNYPLEYKHRFREVIAPEIEKNEEVRVYFDTWGNRCYLFNSITGNYMRLQKGNTLVYEGLEFDMEALRELGCEYLFSGAEIGDADRMGMELVGYFETEDSYWGIWVYRL